MKQRSSFMLLITLLIVFSYPASASTQKSNLPGTWKCSAVNVPYEYTNSTILITKKEGKLEGKVKFEGGTEVSLNYVKQNGNDVVMSVYVEGYEVIINVKAEGNKMTGTADTPDGRVSLSAIRDNPGKR